MQNLENFLVEKTLEYLGHAEVFDQKVLSIRKRMREIQENVISEKSKNKDLKYTDVKDLLIEFHGLHYEHQMIEEELRRMLASLVEIYSIVKIYAIPLPSSTDEQIKKLDDLLTTIPPRLYIVEKKKVVIPDQEMYKTLTAGLDAHIRNEKSLQDIFFSEAFSKGLS